MRGWKKLAKKDFTKTRFNINTTVPSVIIFENPKEKEEWINNLKNLYRRIPLLDSEFPQE